MQCQLLISRRRGTRPHLRPCPLALNGSASQYGRSRLSLLLVLAFGCLHLVSKTDTWVKIYVKRLEDRRIDRVWN